MLGGGPASPRDDEAAASSPSTQPVRGDTYPMPPLTPDGEISDDGGDGAVLVTESPGPGDEVGTDTLAAAAAGDGDGDGALVRLAGANTQIPDRILAAYQRAVTMMASELPGCHLRWQLLASIGRVESNNATGRSITADGTVTPTIVGVALDGKGGRALLRDTDDGALDNDKVYDRAVGPMQFIPSTWKTSGRDASSDGRKDPSNINDAALAAGGYLCAHGRDLTNPAQLRAAIFSYNPSDAYVRAVLAWMTGYDGTSPTTVPIPVVALTPAAGSSGAPSPAVAPVPVVTLAAGAAVPSASASPTSAACATIAVTAGSLAATVSPTASGSTLEVTGTYTAASATATGNVSIHAEARASSAGALLAQADTNVPARPATGSVPLARLGLAPITGGSVTVTLTTTPAGCTVRTLTTVVVTGIPATTPAPTSAALSAPPSSSPSPPPSSSPSSSPTPSATPTAAPTTAPAAPSSSPASAAAAPAPTSVTSSPTTSAPRAAATSTSPA